MYQTRAQLFPILKVSASLLFAFGLFSACLEADRAPAPAPAPAEASDVPEAPLGEIDLNTPAAENGIVTLDLKVSLRQPSADGSPAPVASEPEAVRAALKSAKCLGCHSTAGAQGKLVLDKFPYVSTGGTLAGSDPQRIVEEAVARMTSAERPMPPFPPAAKPENVAVLKSFAEELARVKDTGSVPRVKDVSVTIYLSDASRFVGTLKLVGDSYQLDKSLKLAPNQSYTFDLLVRGSSDETLFELKATQLDVPANGQVQLGYDLPSAP